ncbi:MAG: glycosyltransferase [Betaproteobacteria bacterium]|nr:glycosyltransferase [Betaproteobacteria bacterium]
MRTGCADAARAPEPAFPARTAGVRNVLVLASVFHLGGAETVMREIALRLDPERYRPVFCSLYEPGPIGEELIAAGHPFVANLLRHKYDLPGAWRLARVVRDRRIDVVYFHNSRLALLWCELLRRRTRTPVIAAIHNWLAPGERGRFDVFRRLLPHMNRIVTLARVQKRRLAAGTGIAADRIVVIPNGLDLSRWPTPSGTDEERARALLSVPPGTPVVGIVARLHREKGIDIFIESVRRLAPQIPEARFVIVGDGPENESLRSLARDAGLADRVAFLGQRRDVPDILYGFDVAVLASREEVLPMAILEYMAAARPIVAADVGAVSELVENGVHGLLVPPEDPVALAGALRSLLDDRERARALGRAARQVLERRFSLAETVARTQSLFDEVIDEARRAG